MVAHRFVVLGGRWAIGSSYLAADGVSSACSHSSSWQTCTSLGDEVPHDHVEELDSRFARTRRKAIPQPLCENGTPSEAVAGTGQPLCENQVRKARRTRCFPSRGRDAMGALHHAPLGPTHGTVGWFVHLDALHHRSMLCIEGCFAPFVHRVTAPKSAAPRRGLLCAQNVHQGCFAPRAAVRPRTAASRRGLLCAH